MNVISIQLANWNINNLLQNHYNFQIVFSTIKIYILFQPCKIDLFFEFDFLCLGSLMASFHDIFYILPFKGDHFIEKNSFYFWSFV
jgi:hypothetical protein